MSVVPNVRVVALPRWLSVADAERLALGLAAVSAALLRIAAIFRYRIDSDEPQHLHVIWGWTHGLLQYRDVFDNHMPLFHILFAPLLGIVGERADALIAMRIAMLPLYAAMLALTWKISASCYGRRAAIWSTVAAALVPGFLLCATEFRTDDLWTVFWLMAVALLVSGPLTNHRVAAAGLALGLAAAVSAKTALLLVALIVGAAAAREIRIQRAAIFFAAFTIPVAAVAIYFAARGAWEPFSYGVIAHNLIPHVRIARLLLFPFLLALIAIVARRAADTPQRLFLFITAHFYAAALFCLWPLVEREHWLPYYPLAAATLVPLLRVRQAMALVLIEIVLVFGFGRLWHDETHEAIGVIEQTLQLTKPGQTVMDLKGETVFRQRAFFYVLEPLTKHRIRSGRIRDTIVADMLRTRTMVVVGDHHGFPPATRAFLNKNFVSVGAVRVPGQRLRSASFLVEVPADYALVGEAHAFKGLLDCRPYSGPRYLQAGMHSIAPEAPDSYSLLWSRAADRGLTPKLSSGAHVRTFKRGTVCAKSLSRSF
ncbi:MAG TPA: hypothetical protein VII12_08155 [Thermoanaerobaculia bacterium]